ncbi:lantibiotic dehydratase [Streptomonospora sp. S1-112]|uniref:Lantibiotic dehydratase n=1 Tax=Streptomonospora mangrovi TaxID=2883123 RepID=A0A9X3NQH9_9ACTN|nr:lantibiotic dehydratase [Streptomonospora mangrovi]MDA0564875.1 lantibiotic dehydratase [Streptomonospora mangrovi]
MHTTTGDVLYRHASIALLRAAAASLADAPVTWPDPDDTEASRKWLDHVWSRLELADSIGQASPTLAARVVEIRAGRSVRSKDLRRAVLATARYLLRSTGRPTPFGLFAGIAPTTLADASKVRWGSGHSAVVRADTHWLSDVVTRLEAVPSLLERLDVTLTNLAVRRGRWLEAPHGPSRIRLSYTAALDTTCRTAASPVRFGVLADKLASAFGTAPAAAAAMLGELVREGVLISNLRAPFTEPDPLGHVVDQLRSIGAAGLPEAASLLAELERVHDQIRRHNVLPSDLGRASARAEITDTMQRITAATRSPLAVDLHLDADVQVPTHVATEAARAATTLLRLAREPEGSAGWHSYHRAFVDRYGTGTLVPVTEAVSDAGIGYPPGYPDTLLPDPVEPPSNRDQRLFALAWQAVVDGSRELVITDDMVDGIAGPLSTNALIPPHVEVAARIHAASRQALTDGDYELVISPARAAGVMTSRFTATATGAGLTDVYRTLPTTTAGALPVQMSFGAAYPYAENIIRVPTYLPTVLPLGEHRVVSGDEGPEVIKLDDVAITATAGRLHLVSLSRRRVIEPLVFHALDLTKQPPPLARFLARLSRGFGHGWTSFDWGPQAEELPYLPRVRYGRAVLAPARWRLAAKDLPGRTPDTEWRKLLTTWRKRWRCPAVVELREEDRTLRLDLDQPLHAALLHAQLARFGDALLTEAPDRAAFDWIEGHAHEVAIPLISNRPPVPGPPTGSLPVVTNADAGHSPAAPGARWLYARLHAHPDRHDEIIAFQLPELTAGIDGADLWFIRYHNPEQTDHLRLRIRLANPEQYGTYAAVVSGWAHRLREQGLVGHLLFDTYTPEVGRYGAGGALAAAEAVFVADSRLVIAELRHLAGQVDPLALTVANMVGILVGFFDVDTAMRWLRAHSAAGPATDRGVADAAVELALKTAGSALPEWPTEVDQAWQERTAALHAYRATLPTDANMDMVAESLLHMHHNRARGIDRDGEATCRRLARQAALAWYARCSGPA